jgi:hypothetical protein
VQTLLSAGFLVNAFTEIISFKWIRNIVSITIAMMASWSPGLELHRNRERANIPETIANTITQQYVLGLNKNTIIYVIDTMSENKYAAV